MAFAHFFEQVFFPLEIIMRVIAPSTINISMPLVVIDKRLIPLSSIIGDESFFISGKFSSHDCAKHVAPLYMIEVFHASLISKCRKWIELPDFGKSKIYFFSWVYPNYISRWIVCIVCTHILIVKIFAQFFEHVSFHSFT